MKCHFTRNVAYLTLTFSKKIKFCIGRAIEFEPTTYVPESIQLLFKDKHRLPNNVLSREFPLKWKVGFVVINFAKQSKKETKAMITTGM